MKFLHISDLHIGKRLNEFSLCEDQRYILEQILQISDNERPDAVLISGDLYDKAIPSTEAVRDCDRFLTELSRRQVQTMIISGNHDSAERVSFGSELMSLSGIHLSSVFDNKNSDCKRVAFEDEYGIVNFYLLPFVKVSTVRYCGKFEPDSITDYTSALKAIIDALKVDTSQRNVVLSHQFITGGRISDSEERVGTLENANAEVFAPFDYVALGHLHIPQNVGNDPRIRYCGSPLKYSFSEAKQEKSVTVVELGCKGDMEVRLIPLRPLRDLRILSGTFSELMDCDRDYGNPDDYLRIELEDEESIPSVMGKLRNKYRNIMEVKFVNRVHRHCESQYISRAVDVHKKTNFDLCKEFYELRSGQELDDESAEIIRELLDKAQNDGNEKN